MRAAVRPDAALSAAAHVPAVEVRGVSKSFGQLEVLRDIDFSVAQGEVVALLGASGSGKSTLLNIVSGLMPADSGEVLLEGQDQQRFKGWRGVSYMFQEDRLLPWRSALDNVGFALEADGTPRAERRERAREALAMVGLEAFAKSWPHELSGGMRSRVALARSLVLQPHILLMDEPFSKLDPQTRAGMHTEVLRIQELTGTAILFVTHDVDEAVVLADRVIVFKPRPGRIKEIVTVDAPRPRLLTDRDISEASRQLRLKVFDA
jgi:ABC-type nitrate/sulfonate/bicarbonate transport system ATPase subunit